MAPKKPPRIKRGRVPTDPTGQLVAYYLQDYTALYTRLLNLHREALMYLKCITALKTALEDPKIDKLSMPEFAYYTEIDAPTAFMVLEAGIHDR